MKKELIAVEHCDVKRGMKRVLSDVSWVMRSGEAWLVIGPGGGGKAPFLEALAGTLKFTQIEGVHSYYRSALETVEMVSLERAARLIQEERERDESEYLDGGVDKGRTGASFIAEALVKSRDKKAIENAISRVAAFPEVKLCKVENILDRGLKYMSTGEIRRTLLARALLSGAKCLILSDPFAGLDSESRALLRTFFGTLALKQVKTEDKIACPVVILGMERYTEIPEAITHVIEFRDGKVSFCGERAGYDKMLKENSCGNEIKEEFLKEVEKVHNKDRGRVDSWEGKDSGPLIEMHNVNVGWDGKMVLRNLTWTLWRGEHWLIRGPNGAGKTTFLELITGDNGQVYSNDVKMFGKKRGSGETIWDIKAKLGIVSYRLHVEYRMVGGTSIIDTVASGYRDSIGLYGGITDEEKKGAHKWLTLAGFSGRENDSFSSLSYGEQRSILILRAAVKCPQILILDEPCHALSEEARERVLAIMEAVAKSGTTTLLHVTHEEDEVLECEHHILELNPNAEPMYRVLEK